MVRAFYLPDQALPSVRDRYAIISMLHISSFDLQISFLNRNLHCLLGLSCGHQKVFSWRFTSTIREGSIYEGLRSGFLSSRVSCWKFLSSRAGDVSTTGEGWGVMAGRGLLSQDHKNNGIVLFRMAATAGWPCGRCDVHPVFGGISYHHNNKERFMLTSEYKRSLYPRAEWHVFVACVRSCP